MSEDPFGHEQYDEWGRRKRGSSWIDVLLGILFWALLISAVGGVTASFFVYPSFWTSGKCLFSDEQCASGGEGYDGGIWWPGSGNYPLPPR